ncbi:related to SUR1 protein [Phialocephala subalpina]|uniref:Related to SUR1 protein n=1 Tax=Phialocephala subalpina TaxID=576137 RepID=A0A1L7WV60_9HELO|nr:related to SUR1 protein [Phialocephala subalpina]
MRSRLILLPLILILILCILALRLVGFVHLFFEHAGTAITQEEIWSAHFGKEGEGKKDERQQRIPKIIHQVFHNWKEPGNETMPADWEETRGTCLGKNGDLEYMLWTETKSRLFIKDHYPWFLPTYNGYNFPVQRVDTVRYFLLRHFGGIYIDLDNGCLENLEPLLYLPAFTTDGGRGALSNNILGSAPSHAFWILMTESLIPYNWNYLFPYITISYASGQWFETAIWEQYHLEREKKKKLGVGLKDGEVKEEDKIYRIWMDDRPISEGGKGGGKEGWRFWTQERGGTWVNWDNRLFLWVGDHLILLCVAVVGLNALLWWGARRCLRGSAGGRRKKRGLMKRDEEDV